METDRYIICYPNAGKTKNIKIYMIELYEQDWHLI